MSQSFGFHLFLFRFGTRRGYNRVVVFVYNQSKYYSQSSATNQQWGTQLLEHRCLEGDLKDL